MSYNGIIIGINEKISKLDPSIQIRVKDVLKSAVEKDLAQMPAPYQKSPEYSKGESSEDVLGMNIKDIASMDDIAFKEFAERLAKSKYDESSSLKC